MATAAGGAAAGGAAASGSTFDAITAGKLETAAKTSEYQDALNALHVHLESVQQNFITKVSAAMEMDATYFSTRTFKLDKKGKCVMGLIYKSPKLYELVTALEDAELEELVIKAFLNNSVPTDPTKKARVEKYLEDSAIEDGNAENNSKHHILIELSFVPTVDGLSGVVLDSLFFNTISSVKKVFKTQKKDFFTLVLGATESFIFENANIDEISLLDGWEGYSKAAQTTITSTDVREKLSQKTAPKTPRQLEIHKRFEYATTSLPMKARLTNTKKHGFYGQFGYINLVDIRKKDESVADHPTVVRTIFLSRYGDKSYPDTQCLLKFKPINVTLQIGKTEEKKPIPLYAALSNYGFTEKVQFVALERYTNTNHISAQTKQLLNFFQDGKTPSLLDVLKTNELVLKMKDPLPPPDLEGGRKLRSNTKPPNEAAFVDMCIV